ncbi:MAG TPA: alkaline phosphatase family protein [Streptosporangiaceae bacterium]|nr:alkaline phosphatase family protein [Streptosporangiaceae bacterium]
MRSRLLAMATAMPLLLGVGFAAFAAPASATTNAPKASPCGTSVTAPHYTHVIWIWMENETYSSIIGNTSQAPYINSLAGECGLATNYHNISHPSLPEYIAATSGLKYKALVKFDSDCNPAPGCNTSAPSIFGQGETWKSYDETMPSNCLKSDSGNYAVRHNPPPYYTTLKGCATNDVPYTQFATDLAANKLPAFSFVTPNIVDDMHQGSIPTGDTWLSKNVPLILNSPEYTSGTTALFIVWDEGEGGGYTTGEHCATNTTDISCHVAALVISPSTVAGTKSATLFNHWGLLGTAEQLLGLPKLGAASTAPTLTSAFNL